MTNPTALLLEGFTDLDMAAFARRLVAARKAASLTQEQAAWRADIARANLAAIESGRATGLRVKTLCRLCQVLRCSANQLLGL